MKPPTELQLSQMMAHMYDPEYARQYYLRTRELKGRKPGRGDNVGSSRSNGNGRDPRIGKTRDQIAKGARSRQRKELAEQVDRLEDRLKRIETKIKDKLREEASEDRKSEAKKERARKEAEKPKTAAEKAEDARESKKYREKHKQELKGKSDSKDEAKKSGEKASVDDLKALATKLKGKIALAKQKLAAL